MIARLKRALDSGVALGRGAVLVVDEAGLAGTRDLAKLAAATERSGAKLVLVGDDGQLPEIDAGGRSGRSRTDSARSSSGRYGANATNGIGKR